MDKGSALPKFCLTVLLVLMLGNGFSASSVMADEQVIVTIQTEIHQQAIEAWRASRHERLLQADGWLTLVGLEWLGDGVNRIGSAADNDIRLSRDRKSVV